MQILYANRSELINVLEAQPTNSLEFILLITGAFDTEEKELLFACLKQSIRVLKDGGILYVQGTPFSLPEFGVFLDEHLTFKYWLAVESEPVKMSQLPSVHAAVMLFAKGNARFNIKRTRLPHQYCIACNRTLRDWGGKSHLMNPAGYVISDVIKDIPIANNYTQISRPLFDLLLQMLDFEPPSQEGTELLTTPVPGIKGLVAPQEALPWKNQAIAELGGQYILPNFSSLFFKQDEYEPPTAPLPIVDNESFNVIYQGNALDILKQYPDSSIDLVFADPPYNLDKDYLVYGDNRAEKKYVEWCNAWLREYVRILKPTGSLFVLNLPRWGMYHAHFLNQQLYFQNWIVWDALSEPRGKVMPAHYALLFYTKHPSDFVFNYETISPIDAPHYCLRASCIQTRKKRDDDAQVDVTDIWWDIHRIKHRRDRDYHPCQLPESLMERIIKLTTNPGDIVLDALAGAGTTPTVALKLGRRYVAIDLDPHYVQIMKDKIAQIEQNGDIVRSSIEQPSREITKRALQIELRTLAAKLGRLPTPEDVEKNSQYDLQVFWEAFPTWGKALKAAKLEVQN